MFKKIGENPVGFLVFLIIVLVLAVTYLQQIITIILPAVALLMLLYVFILVMKSRLGGKPPVGAYCTNCAHANHGRVPCRQCECPRS